MDWQIELTSLPEIFKSWNSSAVDDNFFKKHFFRPHPQGAFFELSGVELFVCHKFLERLAVPGNTNYPIKLPFVMFIPSKFNFFHMDRVGIEPTVSASSVSPFWLTFSEKVIANAASYH